MFELFDAYRKENARSHNEDFCDVDYLLRFWRENKAKYLAPLFGDKLILEREVEYLKNEDDLRADMRQMIREQSEFISNFYRTFTNIPVNERNDEFIAVRDAITNGIENAGDMVENSLYLGYRKVKDPESSWYDYEDIKSFTVEFENGRKVQLQQGMKITRAMSQLCAQLGMNEQWEKFRIAHSQVLNQKKLKGTLCLSIHPLDYATASDNANGWSSCMSWREEGCYRLGTVEMMNSPMVICAYLRSDKQHMSILRDDDWNSKKWRAWIIVTKDVILCNRHYPYHQENFAIQCINWVKELVGNAYGWAYEDVHTNFYQYRRDTDRCVDFYTNYMYNDLGDDDIIGCFRAGSKMSNLPSAINISGPAECMVCGREIEYEEQSADTLICRDCDGRKYCDVCGCEVDEEDTVVGPDGRIYCEECFNREYKECENCGSLERHEDMTAVVMPINQQVIADWIDKYGKVRWEGEPKVFTSDMPGYRLWRSIRWNPHTTEEVWLCKSCVKDKHVIRVTDKDGYRINIPDPRYHTEESAYSLTRPTLYNFGITVPTVSWADAEDIETARLVREFWDANWEAFQKDFTKGEETA